MKTSGSPTAFARNFINSILTTFKTIFISIFKNAGTFIILFIGPAFLTLLFGGVYYNDYINDIPIAILDEDHSGTSEMVDNYFLENQRFDVSYYPKSRDEMNSLVNSGKAAMGLYIPPGFGQDVSSFKGSQILAIVDGTNTVVGNNAYAAATTIVQTISAGIEIKLIEGKSVPPKTAESIALSYQLQERILFDPKMTYMNYLMLSFLAVFIQQMMLSAVGSSLIREKGLICSGFSAARAITAALTCFICIIPSSALSLFILTRLYHVPIAGDLRIIILLTLVFVLSLVGPSLIIAALTGERLKYSQVSFMLSLPTFVTSGCVWPADQMPVPVKIGIEFLWPLINYAKPFQEIILKGLEFDTILPNIISMLLYTLFWLPIGMLLYKRSFPKAGDTILAPS